MKHNGFQCDVGRASLGVLVASQNLRAAPNFEEREIVLGCLFGYS